MDQQSNDKTREMVRAQYAAMARSGSGCCGGSCGCSQDTEEHTRKLGYEADDVIVATNAAASSLGCGNPQVIASLKAGETVLDLGSGAGFDCLLAARQVGPSGKVIGVDMTPEMLHRARDNARNGGYDNVEFRLGEIENLPVADGTVDVVISNCVINLSPDKARVFNEAYRVLKPGGRVMVSDMVLTRELPENVRNSLAAYAGCVAGASLKEDYLATITKAGFEDVEVVSEQSSGSGELEGVVRSMGVRAFKSK